MKLANTLAAAALAATCVVGSADAAVVAGPTIGGLATFTDTTTGNHWLKLDSFFDTSGTAMIAAATTAGFTVATRADVGALVSTLPLDGSFATWNSYASVMGQAPNRNLVWGAYTPDPAGLLGWAYAFSYDFSWSFDDAVFPAVLVANGGTPSADEDLWAFVPGTPGVPEPASWALMVAGFGLVGVAARRRTGALAA